MGTKSKVLCSLWSHVPEERQCTGGEDVIFQLFSELSKLIYIDIDIDVYIYQ